MTPRILPFGEAALLATWGEVVTIEAGRRARAAANAVEAMRAGDARWSPAITGATSVVAPFDPVRIHPDEAARVLGELLDALPAETVGAEGRLIELPTRFGGDDGPDLEAVARELGATTADVMTRLAGLPLEVLFLGFAPGFAYLGPLPDGLVVPRLPTPRPRVPPGSVAIAGRFAGVYPSASPGGWRVVGRSDVRLFDPAADPPALLCPGDVVRLVPLDPVEPLEPGP